MAEAPSSSTSTRSTPITGIELVFTVTTGTRFSACVPGWFTIRRPLSSTSVLPVPSARRLIEAVSPRASLRLPMVRVVLNATSPSWGIDRKSSSPEVAAIASISSTPTTVTGNASVTSAPRICEPTTTTVSPESCGASASGASCANAAPALRARAVDAISNERMVEFLRTEDMTLPSSTGATATPPSGSQCGSHRLQGLPCQSNSPASLSTPGECVRDATSPGTGDASTCKARRRLHRQLHSELNLCFPGVDLGALIVFQGPGSMVCSGSRPVLIICTTWFRTYSGIVMSWHAAAAAGRRRFAG
jgi:hypothetical protein